MDESPKVLKMINMIMLIILSILIMLIIMIKMLILNTFGDSLTRSVFYIL